MQSLIASPFDPPAGYAYSDGSVFCPDDAEGRGLVDEDNETGQPGVIFSTDDAAHDITCDACHGLILAQNFEDK